MRRRIKVKRKRVINRVLFGRKFVYLILFSLVFFTFLSVLITANNLSTKGGEIRHLEEMEIRLLYEMDLLINKRNRLGAIKSIKEVAKYQLGMVSDTQSFEYISMPDFAYDK